MFGVNSKAGTILMGIKSNTISGSRSGLMKGNLVRFDWPPVILASGLISAVSKRFLNG